MLSKIRLPFVARPVPHPVALSCLQGMLVFIISGLVILAYCSQASNERTYQEVVWAVCGKLTGVLCEVTIAIYTFGTCIAFLIIIGDQQDKSEVPPQYLLHPSRSALGILGGGMGTNTCPRPSLGPAFFCESSLLAAEPIRQMEALRLSRAGGPQPAGAWHDILSFLPVQL